MNPADHLVDVRPTSNEWDAPVGLFRIGESYEIRRDGTEPEGWTSRTYWPHAVIVIDGVMSEFDRARQRSLTSGHQ